MNGHRGVAVDFGFLHVAPEPRCLFRLEWLSGPIH